MGILTTPVAGLKAQNLLQAEATASVTDIPVSAFLLGSDARWIPVTRFTWTSRG